MKCFKQLVDSKFLAKALEELSRARKLIQYSDSVPLFDPPTIHSHKADKRYVYDCYMDDFGFYNELLDTEDPVYADKNTIFYIHEDPIMFIYSRSKRLITEAIRYSFYVNGDIPIYTTKHVIDKHVWFTTMIDTRIPFPSASPN